MSDGNIYHTEQTTSHSCTHACVAMLLGCEDTDVMKRTGPAPLNNPTIAAILVGEGFFCIDVPDGIPDVPGCYFSLVPSLGGSGALHQVLVLVDDDGVSQILDPAKGKKWDVDRFQFFMGGTRQMRVVSGDLQMEAAREHSKEWLKTHKPKLADVGLESDTWATRVCGGGAL